jgi:hypothetical protein
MYLCSHFPCEQIVRIVGTCQNYHRVHVRLLKKDQQQVAQMLRKDQESARVLRRALILRQLDDGQKVAQVAANVGVVRKTVRAIARRYEEEGLESALYEKPRPGKQAALDQARASGLLSWSVVHRPRVWRRGACG